MAELQRAAATAALRMQKAVDSRAAATRAVARMGKVKTVHIPQGEVLIEIKDICKTYVMGDEVVHANDHLNLTIRMGEFVAIVGKSGSGKSTLMNIIGALDVPTSGTYLLGGEDVGHDLALGGGSQSDVNESGAGDVDGGDLVMRRQGVDKQASEFARIHSYLLGNLERQVGGIVAVLRIARAFHDHLLGQDGHVQLSIGKYLVGLSVDEGGKIRWCHNATV